MGRTDEDEPTGTSDEDESTHVGAHRGRHDEFSNVGAGPTAVASREGASEAK
eukprot:CAMPEP_0176219216 /NCGR_PEP_ID=MMETSP0121_2-20121125/18595_1 /TAXON_ID=160619 /ORGANISM="Kryptoperidinium foliaceum, Strain CCMP 1326" /LENGTH=51 /DNA_ID=CAMNT_0017558373 /DNA_START=171 /DNA_END=323 /DNA_ORIENTATION=+